MSTVETFENLSDYAERYQLQPYDGRMHAFVYINSEELQIGEVCFNFNNSNLPIIENWTISDRIRFYKNLSEVPGNGWMVVYFENFYFLKPYR